jgi:hypothetical protein
MGTTFFSPLYTKDFLGSNVSSPVVNSIFIAVKSGKKKARHRFIVNLLISRTPKRSLTPKRYA